MNILNTRHIWITFTHISNLINRLRLPHNRCKILFPYWAILSISMFNLFPQPVWFCPCLSQRLSYLRRFSHKVHQILYFKSHRLLNSHSGHAPPSAESFICQHGQGSQPPLPAGLHISDAISWQHCTYFCHNNDDLPTAPVATNSCISPWKIWQPPRHCRGFLLLHSTDPKSSQPKNPR